MICIEDRTRLLGSSSPLSETLEMSCYKVQVASRMVYGFKNNKMK